ncbi:ornithine cyclodeaminase family protein [Cognatishimia sp. F0-27]|uniref:ornithine cyclodeaminase family protein n=1 Tax=Cognatishimia sp. F0-27 TaxID=2816855 RepID=UPI001D0C5B35|nr:ornithine cyclodeaminase family protein [Cognatishimia sp. F0-27]MCC1493012.1 ornithine cyclodeaminase family protein [Cognatishimia sp. F0-27]
MPFAPRVLSDDQMTALGLTPADIIAAIRDALVAKGEGRLVTTPKSVIQPGDGRYMMTTLSASDGLSVVKAVTVCPDNPERGLPTITGAIMVMDVTTGLCRAVLDAEWITAMRTPALSAVAAQALAEPDASVITLVGCGVQARSHLEFFATLFPLKTVRALGRGQANIDTLGALAAQMGLGFEVSPDPRSALDGADIVVSTITITYDGAPFLDARWLKPGALAVVTDAGKPWIRESFDAFGTIAVDDREQELSMPDPLVTEDRIAADLTDIAASGVSPSPAPRGFFFRGIAVGDFALSAQVWRKLEHGNG